MATNFLHGVETIEVKNGARSISVVKSAVIGLVGIAPTGPKNVLTLVNGDRDAAQFGSMVPGFSIPQTLDAIFKQGAGTVLVVNIFDATTHTTQVTAEAKTVTDGKLKLSAAPIGAVTLTDNAGDPVEYVKDTDYAIDDFGNFTVLSAEIPEGTILKFTFKKLNQSAVNAAAIIGTFNSGTDVRTGTKCFELAFNTFGFHPKILIAPTFSSDNAVAAELIALTGKYRAITYLDAPLGTTVTNAIAGRGPAGTINFNTSSNRAVLLYPHLKKYDPATDANVNFPASAFWAGLRAAVDNNEGFWVSESNHEIKGILGTEVIISASINDPNTDANLLNEKGITTTFNSYGTGPRSWGNRSAAFPTNTEPDNFVCVRRTGDVIHESIEQACLQFADQPITQGWIDSVRESVNAFIRTLVGRGAVIDGKCKYIPANNSPTELAAGHVVFDYDFMPPTPAERITFQSHINIEYLKQLK